MRVKTKVDVPMWSAMLFSLSVLISAILAMFDFSIFGEINVLKEARILFVSFSGFVILSLTYIELKIPKEKHAITGKVRPRDLQIRTTASGKFMIFKLKEATIVFGAPTPLFDPPNIMDAEIDAYGDVVQTKKLPDFIFWSTKDYLESLTHEIFFATRIKNLNTGEEHEVPLFVPTLQMLFWVSIIIVSLLLLPESSVKAIRKILRLPPALIVLIISGILGVIPAIIIPNWLIEKIKQKRK